MNTLLFAYGSLMMGMGNHSYLADAQFVGDGYLPKATMFDFGAFPAVVTNSNSDEKHSVTGELYSVPYASLMAIDALEGHPHFYVRELHSVYSTHYSRFVGAYTYIMPAERLRETHPIVPYGNWRAYREDALIKEMLTVDVNETV